MTVKVLEKTIEVFRTHCEHCGSKLEFEEADTKRKEYTCCGSPESGMFIKCAACHHWTELRDGWRKTRRFKSAKEK